MKPIPIFPLQRRSTSSAGHFQQISNSWRSSALLQIIFQIDQDSTKYCFTALIQKQQPTLSQLVPATKQETSPPRSFAAEIVFSVMGVRVSLLCSAMTNVLWNLRSSDAFKERKRGVFYLASKLKTVPKSIQCFRESYQLHKL